MFGLCNIGHIYAHKIFCIIFPVNILLLKSVTIFVEQKNTIILCSCRHCSWHLMSKFTSKSISDVCFCAFCNCLSLKHKPACLVLCAFRNFWSRSFLLYLRTIKALEATEYFLFAYAQLRTRSQRRNEHPRLTGICCQPWSRDASAQGKKGVAIDFHQDRQNPGAMLRLFFFFLFHCENGIFFFYGIFFFRLLLFMFFLYFFSFNYRWNFLFYFFAKHDEFFESLQTG